MACCILIGCQNPFAPKIDNSIGDKNSPLSDQSTIDGIFQNFQYAYTFKDTMIYGNLLNTNFIFTYRNYDLGYDVSWGKNEEMKVTYGLFKNAERLDIIWNNIFVSSVDSNYANVVRGFNLTITFNPTDVFRVDGKVNLTLAKSLGVWKITNWIDESNL